jgi:hypothetical protein
MPTPEMIKEDRYFTMKNEISTQKEMFTCKLGKITTSMTDTRGTLL